MARVFALEELRTDLPSQLSVELGDPRVFLLSARFNVAMHTCMFVALHQTLYFVDVADLLKCCSHQKFMEIRTKQPVIKASCDAFGPTRVGSADFENEKNQEGAEQPHQIPNNWAERYQILKVMFSNLQ